MYTFGVMYMYLMLNFYLGTAMPIDKAWLSGAAVFLPTDITFCAIASFVANRTLPMIIKRNYAVKGLPKGATDCEYFRD